MLPFRVDLRPGSSPYKELVYAATKAVVSGELPPGSPFPSVRVLSHELKINPNTAQKAVAELVRDGILEMRPGVGSVVAEWGPVSAEGRRSLIEDDLERLLVEARRLGLTLRDMQAALSAGWTDVFGVEGRGPDAPDTRGADDAVDGQRGGERAAG